MNAQIYDEASEWLVELQTEDPDASTRERFSAWLDASPAHVRAYLEVMSLWEDSSNVDRKHALDLDALIALAKSESNLVPLDVALAPRPDRNRPLQERRLRQPRRRWVTVAAAIVVAISAGSTWYWTHFLRGVYSTGTGEQRTLALSDGTTVKLNAGTRIREQFTDAERSVELLQGQALFRVAKNAARPFVVRSDNVAVRALGTEFDVHQRATGTTISVLEGRVAVTAVSLGKESSAVIIDDQPPVVPDVEPATDAKDHARENRSGSREPEVVLTAGEQVDLSGGRHAAVSKRPDMHIATAWTQQQLAFEFTNIRDAAEEFNRFNSRKLVIDPRGLEDFQVSGTFQALDPLSLDRFVRFLRAQPGLTVTEHGDQINVSKNR